MTKPLPPHGFSASAEELPPEPLIFGKSEPMRELRRKLMRVAGTNIPILIQGESGTGKDVIARLVHCWSPWKAGPFVRLNCPAIPGTLIESELFGYDKGAFTGASDSKPGWVELAEGGTLFLDEIAEIEISLQAKLLHLLQSGRFFRVGGLQEKLARVRILCATNRQLDREIEAGRFRRDLYYRINVLSISLPPLRLRRCDIPELIAYFLALYGLKFDREIKPFSAALSRLLPAHDWPGNIRELENTVRRYVVLGCEDTIRHELLEHRRNRNEGNNSLPDSRSLKEITGQAVREFERDVLVRVLRANNWNCKAAARCLNIPYRTLFYKLREAGLSGKKGARRPDAVAVAVDPNKVRSG